MKVARLFVGITCSIKSVALASFPVEENSLSAMPSKSNELFESIRDTNQSLISNFFQVNAAIGDGEALRFSLKYLTDLPKVFEYRTVLSFLIERYLDRSLDDLQLIREYLLKWPNCEALFQDGALGVFRHCQARVLKTREEQMCLKLSWKLATGASCLMNR